MSDNKTPASVGLTVFTPPRNVTFTQPPDTALRPFQVLDASDDDHPDRYRVVNGRMAGVLPDEMNIPDAVLPDGTDNHCYLTATSDTTYIYGKLSITADGGLPDTGNVYTVDSLEEPDGTYVYLLIAVLIKQPSGQRLIEQSALGEQSLLVYSSADGDVLNPVWSTNGA